VIEDLNSTKKPEYANAEGKMEIDFDQGVYWLYRLNCYEEMEFCFGAIYAY
jgi:hypothetical protein